MLSKYLYLFGISLACLGVSACGNGGRGKSDDRIIGFVSSEHFPNQSVELYEFQPQFLYEGRGYSYAATIYDSNGLDIIELLRANETVKNAANSFCESIETKISRFSAFTPANQGIPYYRMFFNCE